MERRSFTFGLAAAAAGLPLLRAESALAQASNLAASFPTQQVRIIVPFPAGGSADVIPRIVAEALGPLWKQPIIIENKPGAAGNIGAGEVAVAKPDGYTLLSAPPPPIAINQSLYPKLSYDASKFKAISILGSAPNVVAVSNKLPVNSLSELIAYAKANPGKLNVANQGNGSTSHLTAVMFETQAGVTFNQVPYRGTAPALNDLVAGHVDLFFDNIASSLPQQQGGAIKILAVCSKERVEQLPNVPTVAESGLPGFLAIAWFAVVAPEGTPDDIVAKISKDIATVMAAPEVRKKLLDQAAQPIANTPQEAAQFIASEVASWGKVIRDANVKL